MAHRKRSTDPRHAKRTRAKIEARTRSAPSRRKDPVRASLAPADTTATPPALARVAEADAPRDRPDDAVSPAASPRPPSVEEVERAAVAGPDELIEVSEEAAALLEWLEHKAQAAKAGGAYGLAAEFWAAIVDLQGGLPGGPRHPPRPVVNPRQWLLDYFEAAAYKVRRDDPFQADRLLAARDELERLPTDAIPHTDTTRAPPPPAAPRVQAVQSALPDERSAGVGKGTRRVKAQTPWGALARALVDEGSSPRTFHKRTVKMGEVEWICERDKQDGKRVEATTPQGNRAAISVKTLRNYCTVARRTPPIPD